MQIAQRVQAAAVFRGGASVASSFNSLSKPEPAHARSSTCAGHGARGWRTQAALDSVVTQVWLTAMATAVMCSAHAPTLASMAWQDPPRWRMGHGEFAGVPTLCCLFVALFFLRRDCCVARGQTMLELRRLGSDRLVETEAPPQPDTDARSPIGGAAAASGSRAHDEPTLQETRWTVLLPLRLSLSAARVTASRIS